MIIIRPFDDSSDPHVFRSPWTYSPNAEKTLSLGVVLQLALLLLMTSGIMFTLLLAAGLDIVTAGYIGLAGGLVYTIIYWSIVIRPQLERDARIQVCPCVILVSNVIGATSVSDLEDFGPGYLVETGDDEFVFIASQMFDEIEGVEDSLASSIYVYMDQASRDIAFVKLEGIDVDVRGEVPIGSIPVAPTSGFVVLGKGQFCAMPLDTTPGATGQAE